MSVPLPGLHNKDYNIKSDFQNFYHDKINFGEASRIKKFGDEARKGVHLCSLKSFVKKFQVKGGEG